MSLLGKYLKSSQPYKNGTQLRAGKGYLKRVQSGTGKTPIATSFTKTNLDLESNKPQGGPINDSRSGFVHKYLPNDTYLDFIKKYL